MSVRDSVDRILIREILGNRVLVAIDPPPEKLELIFVPHAARDRFRPLTGTVLQLGRGVLHPGGWRSELPFDVGDRVIISPVAGKTGWAFEVEPGVWILNLWEILARIVEVEAGSLAALGIVAPEERPLQATLA